MQRRVIFSLSPIVVGAVLYGLSGCGSSTSESLTQLLTALPSLAISSPTAGSSTTSASARASRLVSRALEEKQVEAPKFNEAVQEFKELAGKPPADAAATVSLKVKGLGNTCFGQGKAYSNHPNGAGSGNTLANDTGFDSETETVSSKTVACPAATMNAKVGELAGLVNEAIKLNYVAASALATDGKEIPTTVGGTATAAISGVPGMNNATATVTKKDTLTGGYETFNWVISGTFEDGTRTGPITFDLTHSRLSDDDFKGIFKGSMPRGSEWYAFSLIYSVSGGIAKYELKSLETRLVGGSTTPTDLFRTNGTVDFSPTSDRQNMLYGVASVGTTNGLGSAVFAWNAGKMDSRSRMFQAVTTAGTAGADTGYAYYGFGDPVNETNLASGSLKTIKSMICAWTAGNQNFIGGTASAEKIGKVQAMRMVRNTTSGEFEPLAGNIKIAYCPTNSCDGAGGFIYGGTACTAANSLGSVGEYGAVTVTAPTYP